MRALVLGGAGFIGSHLVQRLRADGAHVKSIDKDDVDLRAPPNTWMVANSYDVVYLLAATLGVDNVCGDPAEVLRTNIRIVQTVLDRLPNAGETLVYASTSETYALSVARGLAPVPTPEDVPLLADPITPRGAYALSKITGEAMVRHGHSKAVILRYHNVYGPGQARGFVIPELIHGAPVHNPEHTRAFCYIDDAVAQTIAASQHPGQVINIGTTHEVPIGYVAILLQGTYRVADARPGDPPRRCPDTTRLQRLTGITAEGTPLSIGLKRTEDWWHDRLPQ